MNYPSLGLSSARTFSRSHLLLEISLIQARSTCHPRRAGLPALARTCQSPCNMYDRLHSFLLLLPRTRARRGPSFSASGQSSAPSRSAETATCRRTSGAGPRASPTKSPAGCLRAQTLGTERASRARQRQMQAPQCQSKGPRGCRRPLRGGPATALASVRRRRPRQARPKSSVRPARPN